MSNPSLLAMEEEELMLTPGSGTKVALKRLVDTVSQSGNPDQDFFYLGGPMTGIPQFNFPRFFEVAKTLRAKGYNIISPAECDDPDTEKAAMESPDGAPGSGSANGEAWEDFLSRDVILCALPKCVGGIFLEGWHRSSGANVESFVLDRLKKPVFEYQELDGGPVLVQVQRDERLHVLHSIDDDRKKIEEYETYGQTALEIK